MPFVKYLGGTSFEQWPWQQIKMAMSGHDPSTVSTKKRLVKRRKI